MLSRLPFVAAARVRAVATRYAAVTRAVHSSPSMRAAQLQVPKPMEVFDMIDTNGDGVLSKDEFAEACERMQIDELISISKSLSRSELSRNAEGSEDAPWASHIASRLIVMADVTISKIFPAGFGWQMASVYADGAGMEATELPFFVATGFGDMMGVWIGHTAFSGLKKAFGADLQMANEAQTGLLLGSAAFCSGFTWQPTVNALTKLGLTFNEVAGGTVVACCLAFYGGLRIFRAVYGPFMAGVEAPTYANLKADIGLSISIGGATGAFVGTDVSFGDANWLRPYVGVEESMSDMMGQVLAGTSTSLGFTVFQTVQSFVVPRGKCWVD